MRQWINDKYIIKNFKIPIDLFENLGKLRIGSSFQINKDSKWYHHVLNNRKLNDPYKEICKLCFLKICDNTNIYVFEGSIKINTKYETEKYHFFLFWNKNKNSYKLKDIIWNISDTNILYNKYDNVDEYCFYPLLHLFFKDIPSFSVE